jgi:hypothetical protein
MTLRRASTRTPNRQSRYELGGGQFPIPRSPRLEAAVMDVTVAISSERDQIADRQGVNHGVIRECNPTRIHLVRKKTSRIGSRPRFTGC